MGLMLSLARNIPQATASVKRGEWNKSEFLGVELYDKTLGVFGVGRIGAEVARRAQAFEMNVIVYDPYISEERAKEMGATLKSVDEIVEVDFMTFHVPLTDETRGMIGEEQLSTMKDSARLLNVARGGIIVEGVLRQPAARAGEHGHDAAPRRLHQGGAAERRRDRVLQRPPGRQRPEGRPHPVRRQRPQHPEGDHGPHGALHPARREARRLRLPDPLRLHRGDPVEVVGELADEDVEPLRIAGVKGVLTPLLQEPPTYLNAEILAKNRGVNIAGMQVVRHEAGGEAVMLMEIDGEVPSDAMDEIRVLDGVKDACFVRL